MKNNNMRWVCGDDNETDIQSKNVLEMSIYFFSLKDNSSKCRK